MKKTTTKKKRPKPAKKHQKKKGKMSQIEVHPLCEEVPEYTKEQYDALLKSMKENGYDARYPVILYENKVLDGRHRVKAAVELGLEVPCEDWTPSHDKDTPDAFVIRSNTRRDLTPAQRAAWMTTRMDRIEEAAKVRMSSGVTDTSSGGSGESAEIAAKEAKVSRKAIQVAKRAKKEAPEVLDDMKKGKITVNQADRQLKKRGAKFHKAETRKGPPKLPDPIRDPAGRTAKESKVIKALTEGREQFKELVNRAHAMKRDIAKLAGTQLGVHLEGQKIEDVFERLVHLIEFGIPYTTCPYPQTQCEQKTCKSCRGNRWVTKRVYEAASPNIKNKKE